jgi:hypothetical protein
MVFGSELLRNSSFSELLFPLSIPATSLADAAPQRGTRCADRHDAETSSGQDKERLENDNCFLGNFRGTKRNDECQMMNDEGMTNVQLTSRRSHLILAFKHSGLIRHL